MASALSIDDLRLKIQAIEGRPVQSARWQTGVEAIDGLMGGLPVPGLVEFIGAPGHGAVHLALAIAARLTQKGERIAWVDAARHFYPPGADLQGVELNHLLVVRPVADRAAWSTELLVSSGCFPWVVLEGDVGLGRKGTRWLHAAEKGNCCLCVVRTRSESRFPAQVRLQVGAGRMTVMRNRGGIVGAQRALPDWVADPWA